MKSIRINRVYQYKGNRYKVLASCKVKNENSGEWIPSILYEDKSGEEFVRSIENFTDYFIPVKLEKGDPIMVISHGKMLGVVDVVKEDSFAVVLSKQIGDSHEVISNEPIFETGFIQMSGHWEYYYYNKTSCLWKGIGYKRLE